ncbi:MAG: SLC13 family permease [Sphingobium sp.]
MTADQIITLVVLMSVVAALIADKLRGDVVALAGAAMLLMTGVVRPVEVQGAFASPAIIALASLFVIAYALELSGLLDRLIEAAMRMCARIGAAGLWVLIGVAGALSAFLNNTPIVVLSAPVVRDVAKSLKVSPRRYLIPLSYMAVLGGGCTLIGTSTNLLVNDMASVAGQSRFGIFEITPVGVLVALSGALYLFLIGGRLLESAPRAGATPTALEMPEESDVSDAHVGQPGVFATRRPLQIGRALLSLGVFVAVVAAAAFGVAPIAATAFAGAVVLILARVITADEAYGGLRPEILILIAGMVVIGIAVETSGLAAAATQQLVSVTNGLDPILALILLYGATLFLTELLSNATVAVLVTPIAVSLAQSLGVSPRPFLVAVMMAGSSAFATPFGYQTNVIVFQMGGYRYMDFMRVGMPLNLITWAVAVAAILVFFPF